MMGVRLEQPVGLLDYWGSHPDYPIGDWQLAAVRGETRMGYWSWVRDHLKPDDGIGCRYPEHRGSCNDGRGCSDWEDWTVR